MPESAASIESLVEEIIERMLDDLNIESEVPLHSGTKLIADLGFASVDFVALIVEIESRLGRKVGFHNLLMPNGQYVSDLAIGDFVTFILSTEAGEASREVASPAPVLAGSSPVLSADDLAEFRKLLPTVEQWGGISAPSHPNPRIAFVLSASRSGSTLLQVILAGNPSLFAPPELHLLYYATMDQRHRSLNNELNAHLLTAAVQAVMHLTSCTREDAAAFVSSCEEAKMPTHEFYRVLQERLNGRLFVDKTPTYAMNTDVLRNAERTFEQPLFVHLVRHPCGMIRSYEDGKLDQLTPFMRNSRFTSRQLGELIWLCSNQNIVDFLGEVPAERWLRIRYEDMVREPEPVLRRLSDFLGVPFDSQMLDPYKDPATRMTGGVKSVSQFSGDLKFHLHSRIEPEAADRWRKYLSEDSLSAMSRQLAASFGY